MLEQTALTVASVAVLAAATFAILRWDRRLGSVGNRYSLRTLLILMAVGPPMLAGAWPIMRQWLAPKPDIAPLWIDARGILRVDETPTSIR